MNVASRLEWMKVSLRKEKVAALKETGNSMPRMWEAASSELGTDLPPGMTGSLKVETFARSVGCGLRQPAPYNNCSSSKRRIS